MEKEIYLEKLEKYFSVTKEALEKASVALDERRMADAKDFFNMIQCYYNDAKHFFNKGDYVNAFAALNYAHGWLDAGARIRLFKVDDSRLFTVDKEHAIEKDCCCSGCHESCSDGHVDDFKIQKD
ncbi:DUF357 domain-containing protein [archaeon]|jgi:uncharacterized protein|nr:DUF357 domain-containing protein [archaeon]MBT3451387.1 DUF357 domain-containing protein [archaeon]MBT6868965.1 DUF357 domain-containing protein [archaeon]MBT7193231.1 DUF357 domain-containing protein [archaeon]MBT7380086.1 DUF357 domain-containing protein [archaeon]